MRESRVKQFDLIRETDPLEFKNKLNDTMKRLAGKNTKMDIDVSGEFMNALIEYSERVFYEDPEEEDEMIRFHCVDCPIFQPALKMDGTPDLRVKWGSCPYARMHRTSKDSHACGVLYSMLKNGDIVLTLNKLED